MPYPVCFYLILRSSVAAVTPGHPNQSLCPVCVGMQRREREFSTLSLRSAVENGSLLWFRTLFKTTGFWGKCEEFVLSASKTSKGMGKWKEKGNLEVKLWLKRKKSQTPKLGIEPGTSANVADALPLRFLYWKQSSTELFRLVCR